MYWKTRKKPNSGDWVCSHWARLNSMGRALGIHRHQRGHHLFHLHEARALDEHRGACRRLRQRIDQLADTREMPRGTERGTRMQAQLAGRPQRIDAALARVGADLAVKRRAFVADFAHVAEKDRKSTRLNSSHTVISY